MTPGSAALPDTSWIESSDAKDRLRQVLRTHRSKHHQHPEQGHLASCQALTEHALEAVGPASTVACYVSVGAEPCTLPLLQALHDQGTRVLLPALGPRLARSWAWFRGLEDLAQRAPGRPPEPGGQVLEASAIGQAEVVLAPALAIDQAGNRIGQGGGWYDRVLPMVSPLATVFAVVHPDELVRAPLPTETHDRKVDAVITAEAWFLLRGSAFSSQST